MKRSALKYRLGTWFCVPLTSGGFAVGLVARMSRGGRILYGYFFGPALAEKPDLAQVADKTPGEAVLVCRFGDLSLQDGTWPVIGHSEIRAADWPLRPFARVDDLAPVAFRVEYDDADPNVVRSETRITVKEASSLDVDGLYGAGAVELVLTDLLDSQPSQP